jgi:nitrate reductase assembly molybdenum cofactor insertion protein NarJ
VSGARIADARQRERLREAVEWRLLGLLFEPPSPAWREQVRALIPETESSGLQAAAQAAVEEARESLFCTLFGPGGSAPAREASCTQAVELGSLMAELAAYYEAFGYQPATAEPPDHIAVELGFMGYLRLKEAYALACEDAERAALTAEAAERFLRQHLRVLAGPLVSALRSSGIRYLQLAGQELVRRAGVEATPARTVLPVMDDPFDCGVDG